MATLAEVRTHQQAVGDLTTLAQAELVATWQTADPTNPDEIAEASHDVLPTIIAAYALAGTTLAADFYEDLREAADAAGSFVAQVVDGPDRGRVDALLGWGLAPLFRRDVAESLMLAEEYGVKVEPADLAPDFDGALSRLSGGLQRIIANADRDTIEGNAALDPVRPKVARYASANACAFCRMLATRGAVYASEESALRITGRRGRTRGSRPLGSKYHDFCRCVPVLVFPGQEYEPAPHIADWQEQYAESIVTSGPRGAIDLAATLAAWREQFGAT